jgi:ankyrin repeat protein
MNRCRSSTLFVFLRLACNAGHYDIVELLIKYHANVNIQSTSGNTALHYAAGGVSRTRFSYKEKYI